MDLGAHLLQLFLVGNAEVLLLVDDDETEVLELDGLAKERMGADDDVDGAFGKAFLTRASSAAETSREACATCIG